MKAISDAVTNCKLTTRQLPVERRVFSAHEVAVIFNISDSLTYRLARAGKLPGVICLGPRRIVFSQAAILEYTNSPDK